MEFIKLHRLRKSIRGVNLLSAMPKLLENLATNVKFETSKENIISKILSIIGRLLISSLEGLTSSI